MGSACSSVEAYREATEDAFFACLLSLSDSRLHILRFARQHPAEEKKRLPGISVAEFMRAAVRPVTLIPSVSDGSLGRLSFRGVDIGLVSQRNGAYRVSIGEKLAGEVSRDRPCLVLNFRDLAGRHQLLTEAVLWGRASITGTPTGESLNAEQRRLIRSVCSPLRFQNHHCYWGSQRQHVFKCGICLLSAPDAGDAGLNSWDQLHWHLYFFHGLSRYYIAKYFSRCLCRVCNSAFCLREQNNCRCPSTRWAAPSVRVELVRSLEDSKGRVPEDLDPFQHLNETTVPPIIVTPASRATTAGDQPSMSPHLTDFPAFSKVSADNVQNLTASSHFPAVSDPLLQPATASVLRIGGDAWQELLLREGAEPTNPKLFVSDADSVVSWPSLPEPELKLNLTGESFRPKLAPLVGNPN